MILVDRQINDLLASGSTFLQNYKPGNVQNIAYDLRTRAYYAKDKAMKSCELVPGASVYVESMEIIELPANLVGRVLLCNSRIRQGLQLAAPLYQPGHKTRVYFRITNISNSKITLEPEEELASIQSSLSSWMRHRSSFIAAHFKMKWIFAVWETMNLS